MPTKRSTAEIQPRDQIDKYEFWWNENDHLDKFITLLKSYFSC